MRITIRITSAADKWSVECPRVDYAKCWPKDGSFDEAEFRREVRGQERVQIGGRDDQSCLRFSTLLLDLLGDWIDRNAYGDGDPSVRREAGTMRARAKRGSFAFVRIDVDGAHVAFKGRVVPTVAVRVTHKESDVPTGGAFDRECAMYVAKAAKLYHDRYVAHGLPGLVLSDETLALAAEADAATNELKEKGTEE